MNQIFDYLNQLNFTSTATLIHVASDAIREGVSLKEAYINLEALESIKEFEQTKRKATTK